MNPVLSADIFCKVIDNFGDAGVCWRLARALARSGLAVRLWIDNLQTLQRLRPSVEPSQAVQTLDGFMVVRWDEVAVDAYQPADLVIEAFACRITDPMLDALADVVPRPAWINLEYLSAESWVKSNHALPSPHPRLPLTQYFYFPGFEQGTGGLIREEGLRDARASFDSRVQSDFLASLGITRNDSTEGVLLVSLFCYASAPIEALLRAMQTGPRVHCWYRRVLRPSRCARAWGAGTARCQHDARPPDIDHHFVSRTGRLRSAAMEL